MTSYRFYLDEKCTVWVRTYFTVEAPDRDTAASCAARIAKGDLHDTQRPEDGIAIDASETLYDSMEALPAEDNDDRPTREIFFENGDDVADNVSGPSWDAWWRQLDSGRKKRIMGLRQTNCDGECDRRWAACPEAEKIAVWNECRK